MNTILRDLVAALEIEIKKAQRSYQDAKRAAQEIAASASSSPSQSGDRFHSQGSADLASKRFQAILSFKKEFDKKGEAICVKHKGETLFLVDNPIMLAGFKIVSTKSPLGLKLLNDR